MSLLWWSFLPLQKSSRKLDQSILQDDMDMVTQNLKLLDMLLEYFGPAREKYERYMNDYSLVQERLDTGNEIANKIHGDKYEEMKKIVGL